MAKQCRIALSLLLVLLTLVSLTACAGNQPTADGTSSQTGTSDTSKDSVANADGRTKITYLLDQGLVAGYQPVVDAYNESQVKYYVEFLILPQDTTTVHDDLVNKLAVGDTSVDVFNLDGTYVTEFAAAGWLTDFGEYFSGSEIENLLPSTREQMSYNGELVAMPGLTNGSMLFYRKDVLEEIGAEVPTTYEGWMELADQAVGVNGVEYLAVFQAAQGESLVCNWCEFIWNNGADLFDADGNPQANSPKIVEATKIMADLAQNYAPSGITTYAETESEQVFLEGKALILRDWVHFWKTSNDEEKSKVAGKVGMTLLPIGPEGDTPHTCLGGSCYGINNFIDDEHKQGAADFIRFANSFDSQKAAVMNSGEPSSDERMYKDADVLEAYPFLGDFYEALQDAKARPKTPYYAQTSDAIQRNIHQALTSEVDVETALDTLQQELLALQN